MALTYLASSLLMGVLLFAVVFFLINSREWYQYTPALVGTADDDVFSSTARFVQSPVTWTASFLVFVFALLLAGLAFVGSDLVPVSDPAAMGTVLAAIAALLVVVYVFAGAYYLVKSRGLGNAAATGAGAALVALLFLVAVFVNLLFGG